MLREGLLELAARKPLDTIREELQIINILEKGGEGRDEAIDPPEIVDSDDIGDEDTRGRVVIFRDFCETGQHEEIWDRMVLLSGLAALERADME
jgi:hypothetical protein